MSQTNPPSTRTVIEHALDDTITRLSRGEQTPGVKANLIEARRLRSIMASWRAIPPPADARREMLAKVMTLAAAAGSQVPGSASEPYPTTAENDTGTPGRTGGPDSPRSAVVPSRRAPAGTGLRTGLHLESPAPSAPLERRTSVAPGVAVVRPEAMEWRPYPGTAAVSLKVIRRDAASGQYTAVVRMAPKAELPRHRHVAVEQLLMLEGSATIGETALHAGEICVCEADSVHEAIRSAEGCTFLLVGSERDELL